MLSKTHLCLLHICFVSWIFANPIASEANDKRITTPTAISLIEKWRGLFGDIDFSNKLVYERMIYLHPQHEECFTPISNEKLYVFPNISRFFNENWQEKCSTLEPVGYYMNQGRVETSLLLYQFQYESYEITMEVSFNVCLIIIRPNDFNPKKGINGAVIKKILRQWLALGNSKISKDETLESLSFPDSFVVGDIRYNNNGKSILSIRDWREDILLFMSEKGLCLYLFKAFEDSPSQYMGGPYYKYDWLNGRILEVDGVKPISFRTSIACKDPREKTIEPDSSNDINIRSILPPKRGLYSEWQTNDGKIITDAKFVSVLGSAVVLEQKDGEKINVEVANLSQKDWQYFRTLVPESNTIKTLSLVKGWKNIFGDIDFGKPVIFNAMVKLHPKLLKTFVKFDNKILSSRFMKSLIPFRDDFFVGKFRDKMQSITPTGFYLNGERVETSLLLYQLQIQNYNVTIQESYNVVLIIICPNEREHIDGMEKDEIEKCLSSILNFSGDVNIQKRIKWFSQIPDYACVGTLFYPNEMIENNKVESWRDMPIGFVSGIGLSVMLEKLYADSPVQYFNGTVYDFNWLDNIILNTGDEALVVPQMTDH